MARLTIRLDEMLHERLLEQARLVGTTPSAYLRDILVRFEGADPSGYHSRFDELHATILQTLAILAASVGQAAPDALEQGMADARQLLRDRGLLDVEQDR
jgi:hypothetical protein